MLDRYRRAVSAVESRASSEGAFGSTIAGELTAIAEQEIECPRAVLRSIGYDREHFDAAVEASDALSPVERFSSS